MKTYDPKKVVVTFAGVTISGYMDGTFVNVAPGGEAFEKHKGADGSIDRVNKSEFGFRVTLTLKQTSPINPILAGLLNVDKLTNAGIATLLIQDLNGSGILTAPQAWLVQDPESDWSDSMSGREWIIDTGLATYIPGGNK
ncbi:phage structural protein [Treponema sp. R6D11]